jgi:amidophosphoribosyltransferase
LKEFIFLEEVMLKYTKKGKTLKIDFTSGTSAIDQDTDNTVFSYIPNTAETSFTV